MKLTRRNRGASAAATLAAFAVVGALGFVLRERLEAEQRFTSELAVATLARAAGDHDAALQALERALSLRPEEGTVLAERESVRRAAAAARAEQSVARARGALDAYRADAARLAALTGEALPLRQAVTTRPMSAEESARLLGLEDELAELARALEGRFAEIIEALNLARGLDPEHTAGEDVLAELYLDGWRAATAANDARGERHYRALVAAHDPAGRHASELHATVPLTLATSPAGAEVFLFRYEEQAAVAEDGEPRLVPVPVGGEPPRASGAWALRVVAGAGGLEPEDLVLAVAGHPIEGTMLAAADGAGVTRFDRLVRIDGATVRDAYDAHWLGEDGNRERAFVFERDGAEVTLRARKLSALAEVLAPRELVERGGVPIEVWRRGSVAEMEVGPGLTVRATAAPLFRSDACRLGETPLAPLTLAPGSYLALVCEDGHESVRVPFTLAPGVPNALALELLPLGTSPPGFVRVPAGTAPVGGDAEAFATLDAAEVALADYWIQEREVGVVEYLEFVNDPATLAEIDASPRPIRVPRDVASPTGGLWERRADGTFEPPAHTRAQPVHGVSWHDAVAYARWRTERARAEGSPFTFALPSEIEWERAARGADRRAYPFGNRFVPRWVKGFFARDRMLIEPGLRFPIDESPYGVFDLAGSQWEWCADEWQGGRALRGGGWNFTFPAFFRAASRAGQDPAAADGLYGFRLVARRAAER